MQRGRQPEWPPGEQRAAAVGFEFARAADGHLHQSRRKRRQNHDHNRADDAHLIVAPVAAEEEGEIGEHGNGASDGRGDRHGERVAILHMGKLMGEHAGEFLLIEPFEDACRHADSRVFGTAARGKGIGLRVLGDIDAWHRQTGVLRERAYQMHKVRRARLVDFLRAVHGKDHSVRVPIGEKIGAGREQEGHEHAHLAADQITDSDKQARERRHQNSGTNEIH